MEGFEIVVRPKRAFCYFFFAIAFMFSVLTSFCDGFKPKSLDASLADSDWLPAVATWYGSPNGAGSDGGACGYGSSVKQSPFSGMVSAGGPSLFKQGKGCGACYQIKCKSEAACSGHPTRVVITDSCPGGTCASDSTHFDLSGTAFGSMAVSHQAQTLLNLGVLQILFRKVACDYSGKKLAFHVAAGANPYYFATLIQYEDGDGGLRRVELKQASDSDTWHQMNQSSGAIWKLDSPTPLQAPFSLRLTALSSGNVVVADGVIPADWRPDQTYRSIVNFDV